MSKILVLSNEMDAHLRFVTNHLMNEEVLRIDPTDMLDGDTIDYAFNNGNVQVYYKDKLLDDVKSVWFRRPTAIDARALPVRARHAAYVKNAATRHLEMLNFVFPDALWVSHPSAIRVADVKIVQLRLAAKLGFNVPETLFASTPRRAKEFVDKHGICIAKMMTHTLPFKAVVFTKILHSTDNIDYTNLNLDPYTFQQYIEPEYELRVTIVDDKVFAAKVEGDEIDGVTSSFRDWRYAYSHGTFKATKVNISEDLAQKCIRLVRELGLEVGALDLIVDKTGQAWFLENNSNAQWAFIEEATGQPIGEAIAAKLKEGKQR